MTREVQSHLTHPLNYATETDVVLTLLLPGVLFRSSHRSCFMKKILLKISQNSQENTFVGVCFYYSSRQCPLYKKWSFPLRISSVNGTRYWKSPTYFLCIVAWKTSMNGCFYLRLFRSSLLGPFQTSIIGDYSFTAYAKFFGKFCERANWMNPRVFLV